MKESVVFVILSALLFLGAVPGTVLSQVIEGQSQGVYTLGEVVVSAEGKGVEQVGTVYEITEEDIRNQGVRTLNEALALLPGLSIRSGAQGVPRVDLRGFRGRHVVLLLDGIPFNSTYDGQFDPSIISVESIAKIKVSYGTHSVLYGDGGLGGVINIVTRKGKKGFEGAVSGEMGEQSTRLGKAALSGAQDKFDFFVSASAYETDGFAISDDFRATSEEDGGLRENSDRKRNNLFANLGLTPTDDLALGLVVTKTTGEYGIPPSTINDNKDPFASRPRYERVEDFDGYSGQLSASYNATDALEIRSGLFVNQMEEEKNRYDDDGYDAITKSNNYSEKSTTRITGLNLQARHDLGSAGSLALALNGRQEKWEADGWIVTKNDPQDDYNYMRKNKIYVGALEYTVSPVDKMEVVLGYSHNWLKKDSGENDSEGSYLAGVYYDIREGTRLKGSYARKIRFPSIRQLYDDTAGSGNPDLKPEKSDNYELGIIQSLPHNTTIGLTGFYIDAQDYIEKIGDLFVNNDQYRFQGIEVTAETRFVENLMLRLGYTFLDTEDKSPDSLRTDLQYRPRHKLTLEGKYAFDFGLSAYMSIVHVKGRYDYSSDFSQKLEMDQYTLVNMKIDQTLLKGMLTLYVGADNLFDEYYEDSYGFLNPGRYFYGGVEFKF